MLIITTMTSVANRMLRIMVRSRKRGRDILHGVDYHWSNSLLRFLGNR